MTSRTNKVFQFFNKSEPQPLALSPSVDTDGQLHKPVQRKNWISATASGGGIVVLADVDGPMHILNNDMALKATFEGFAFRTDKIVLAKEESVLIGIGSDDDDKLLPYLKLWRVDPSLDYPTFIDRIPLVEKVPAAALAVSRNVSHVAVGLADGRLILFSGDLIRRGGAHRIVGFEKNTPITSLWFSEVQGRLYLFVTTTNTIGSYRVAGDNLSELLILESTRGCEVNCSTLSSQGHLIVGDSKNCYSFHPRVKEGVPLMVAKEGTTSSLTSGPQKKNKPVYERRIVSWFRRYLVLVDQDINDPRASALLTVYDPQINIIAYTGPFDITHIICEWSSILLLNSDCQVTQLNEIDTKTKMDTLCKKNNYPVALEIAETSDLDPVVLSDIHQKYGDHLCSKRDFDGAIQQYIYTIGILEPSYVIKRFLDAQRIVNLTNYLNRLHEHGLANSNHTTLLLNCYTKLSSRVELDAFLEKPDLEFDVETAIKVCRQAGYFREALDLAKRKQRHDWYLKILLEDEKQYGDAIVYLMNLPVEAAVEHLYRYGKIFIETLPTQTIQSLIQLWPSYQKDVIDKNSASDLDTSLPSIAASSGFSIINQLRRTNVVVHPEDFISVFVEQPQALIQFLQFIVLQPHPRPSERVCHTLLELYLRADDENQTESHSSGQPPRPTKKEREAAAMALLTNKNLQFDVGHALVLCQVHKFQEGILDCYEKLKRYTDILQYHMDNENYELVQRTCQRLGQQDSSMWVKVLSYFAAKPQAQTYLNQVLSLILAKKYMPPLQVIHILATSDSATLGLVRDHVDRSLKDEQRQIDEDSKAIKDLTEDTSKKLAEIQMLKSEAKIFREPNCSGCGKPLELPTVHFLCGHAFHLHGDCLIDENECAACASDVNNFNNIQNALITKSRAHDEFFKMLRGTNDRFGVVAQYFGRNIFSDSVPAPVTTATSSVPSATNPPSRYSSSGTRY